MKIGVTTCGVILGVDAEAFTPKAVLEPTLKLLFVPIDWLKLAVPVPVKLILPALGVLMSNISSMLVVCCDCAG